jgi:hypothetical protein
MVNLGHLWNRDSCENLLKSPPTHASGGILEEARIVPND